MASPNIFISWSGDRSRIAALAFKNWLPIVVQTAVPWMSEIDIEKGTVSDAEIGEALRETKIGIICLTPENLNSQWILYEAGSISKSLNGDKNRVCIYRLCNLRPEDIRPPLARFQGTKFEKEETRKLVKSISRAVGGVLDEAQLDRLFDRMWPELESELLKIPAQTPMTEPPLRTEREMIAELLELSRANSGSVERQVRELSHLITGLVAAHRHEGN